MFYEVLPIRVFRTNGGVLTYSSDMPLKPGHIVEIPLGRSKTYGIVIQSIKKVDFKTKPITRILYNVPLPPHILKSIFWLSKYYLVPLPQVAKLFLPAGLGKIRRKKHQNNKLSSKTQLPCQSSSQAMSSQTKPSSKIPLNLAQKQALETIRNTPTATKLLHGITGSGKTNIYLKLTENALKDQKSVILLVPEIALTSQLVQIFQQSFQSQITLIHSRQTEAERHLIWKNILQSTTPQIIIGPRSALLSPISNLGLIIIDEAHEPSFFQENNPKYSALRLASFMAQTLNISCIYGTATPLVSDYHLAQSKNALISLSQKAKTTAKTPNFHIIDLRDHLEFSKNRYFSDKLLSAIADNLENHHQTLIFHNRRGSAPLTICENCGWQALCPNCFLPLTLHSDTYQLICHTCGYAKSTPSSCPECHNPSIIHKGFGTKLLETELKRLFKSAKIIRFDADNAKSETLDTKFTEVKNGNYDIIIGTQTIAKGLDLPLLATVGIVQADAGLSLPDFSSEERCFHLLTQVIGRVGRGHLDAANIFIQTYQPNHPIITAAVKNDYQSFYQHILKNRHNGHFPPFYYLAQLSFTYKTEAISIKHAKSCQTFLIKEFSQVAQVSQPAPAFHEHTNRGYTWQLTLRTKNRPTLLRALTSIQNTINLPSIHLSICLDPPSLL